MYWKTWLPWEWQVFCWAILFIIYNTQRFKNNINVYNINVMYIWEVVTFINYYLWKLVHFKIHITHQNCQLSSWIEILSSCMCYSHWMFYFIDKVGQASAELISTLEIILGRLRGNSIASGGVLIIFTPDHTQFLPVKGKQFLISSHILSCFKIVILKHYFRAWNDTEFQQLQQIERMNPGMYSTNPELLREFRQWSGIVFTFFQNGFLNK